MPPVDIRLRIQAVAARCSAHAPGQRLAGIGSLLPIERTTDPKRSQAHRDMPFVLLAGFLNSCAERGPIAPIDTHLPFHDYVGRCGAQRSCTKRSNSPYRSSQVAPRRSTSAVLTASRSSSRDTSGPRTSSLSRSLPSSNPPLRPLSSRISRMMSASTASCSCIACSTSQASSKSVRTRASSRVSVFLRLQVQRKRNNPFPYREQSASLCQRPGRCPPCSCVGTGTRQHRRRKHPRLLSSIWRLT